MMIRIFFSVLSIALLTSCAVSNHSSVLKQTQVAPLNRILILLSDDDLKLTTFDSAFYTNHIQDHFNTLEGIRYRNHLEKTFQRNLQSKGTVIIKSADVFPVNDPIPYSTFRKTIDSLQVHAVLVINLREYWTTLFYDQNNQVSAEPNASFNTYLVRLSDDQIVWMGNTIVNGIYAGYDTINNTLARKIAVSLRKHKLIYPADPTTR
ncbi:MAG: hypothetical protein QY309_13815 [Cyclobacteriaceae bacterium]|nr:MAG: hypothetical protein QY309_13815 [Cyclobacteriaceae bacterium]